MEHEKISASFEVIAKLKKEEVIGEKEKEKYQYQLQMYLFQQLFHFLFIKCTTFIFCCFVIHTMSVVNRH
jgi:hypothetical protein